MHDVVAELTVGLKDLAAEDRSGWSSLARSDRFRDVQGLHEKLEVERIRTVATWDRFGDWAEDGAVTAVSWVRHQFQLPRPEAAALIRLARHYDQHTSVREALDGGEISLAKTRVLVRAERGHEELFAACVEGLVGYARDLDLGEFSDVMAEWVELADEGDAGDDEKRSWRSSTTSGIGRGVIDGSDEDLNTIQAAIDALDTLDPVDGPEPPRSREQRHYDIVVDIFRRALADELGDDPAAVSNVDVVVDAEVAAELVQAPSERAELFDGDPLPEVLRPFRDGETDRVLRRCHHPDGQKAKRVVAEAMLCFSFIRRILIDPTTGQPLDVGRAHRRFTPRQVRALVIRDGGCAFPGCDRKPKWCDAHHLKPWEDDGPTDLDNGCLLCRRHHTKIHHGGWSLERDKQTGIFTATSPTGRTYTSDPRRPCQRR